MIPFYLEMTEESILQQMHDLLGGMHINNFKQRFYDATLSEKERIKALINWSREGDR